MKHFRSLRRSEDFPPWPSSHIDTSLTGRQRAASRTLFTARTSSIVTRTKRRLVMHRQHQASIGFRLHRVKVSQRERREKRTDDRREDEMTSFTAGKTARCGRDARRHGDGEKNTRYTNATSCKCKENKETCELSAYKYFIIICIFSPVLC